MKNRIEPPLRQGDVPLDCLTWAEQNLSSLAKFAASKIDGGETDTIHLAATFALLRARQEIRECLRFFDEVEVAK